MRHILFGMLVFCCPLVGLASDLVIVLQGAAGEQIYGDAFADAVGHWEAGCKKAGVEIAVIGNSTNREPSALAQFEARLKAEPTDGDEELWIILIGHGTFDGRHAMFNLPGPDLSSAALGEWLKGVSRPVVIVDGSASSAPFLRDLSRPGRVVITATANADERNYARFGRFFAEAITDPKSDIDKDEEISLLEAYQSAVGRVNAFYELEGRLIPEHALLDDNGDQRGTPADWFEGPRVKKQAKDNLDPDGYAARQLSLVKSESEKKLSAEQRKKRNQLERDVFKLRDRRGNRSDEAYYQELEALLLQIGEVYEGVE